MFDRCTETIIRQVGDIGRMVGQALTNILKNAGEAVASRRAITPRPGDGKRPGVSARLEVADGMATFIVEDDGGGLPATDRERLTEPYVTTREKGTGLGLAIVKRICEEHGGELRLAVAVHLSGARVCLVFPLKSPLQAAAAGGRDAKAPRPSTVPAGE